MSTTKVPQNHEIKNIESQVNENINKKEFDEIAKEIIKTSIRSAICIDDRFIEPYMLQEEIESFNKSIEHKGETLSNEIPRSLYKSFREEGDCDLDIYHFKSIEESWNSSYMLNNKDLVILDWELEGKGNYGSTLLILKEIIDIGKIPFVIIYTQKPEEEFYEISEELISNFNNWDIDEQDLKRKEFFKTFSEKINSLTDHGIDEDQIELFWEHERVLKILSDLINNPARFDTIKQDLLKAIEEELSITDSNKKKSTEKKLNTVLNSSFGIKGKEALLLLTYLLLDSKNTTPYKLQRIDVDDIGFKINNCIVTIFSKPDQTGMRGVSPENVFESFSKMISSSPHNFITLLSLEMRDRLREDFSKIGNGISQIDERAFFYHMDWYKSRSANYLNQFYDFLLKSWLNELNEYNINLKPKIFDVIGNYRDENELNEIDGYQIINPLVNLAVKLSTVDVLDREIKDENIRFGDVFEFKLYSSSIPNEVIEEGYFLSLTPHCVCVDSSKIDNNFYFIKSENVSENLTSALKKIETDYYSFIKNESIIHSVYWGACKPFTMYIEINNIKSIEASYTNKKIELKYITTLQENFAQRISNKAFSYGTSIGIDLPHLIS
ncbi:response regulator receiver domain [uncultured Tenacibaculum sp.]|uniref:response regulator receiver domain n=1 Tax=uncultured Tenacibaculum sp. TaxID=174713 RepID=UPI0026314455|nr:response regulator receiver domain [uncultured Tenacibaculum sp.]